MAEFSEMEGPIPICTIPENISSTTKINLNNLAVHLISTDYQVNTVYGKIYFSSSCTNLKFLVTLGSK